MQDRYSKLNIIFHHPRPITDCGISGSQVRPYKILEAFKKLGAKVWEVTGDIHARSAVMRDLKKRIVTGEHFDFVYSENLTIPFAMSEHHRLPLNPFVDHRFLQFCDKHGIPVGMFYRDIYWRDEAYKSMLPWWIRMVTIPLYWYDWWRQMQYLKILYLPSKAMVKILPHIDRFNGVRFLPPGTEIKEHQSPLNTRKSLHLFYVGGIEPPIYDLRPLLAATRRSKTITLTLCCRKKEWNALKDVYEPYLTDQINIVHESGQRLEALYKESDLFAVVRGQSKYLDYAAPTKIYESIGYALPVLCSPGGEPSRIVEAEGFGWVKSSEELPDFLDELAQNPELRERKVQSLKNLRHQHTWIMRAAQVCNDLAGIEPKHLEK